jgi:hypothetical protein
MDKRELIIRRAAQELKDGDVETWALECQQWWLII